MTSSVSPLSNAPDTQPEALLRHVPYYADDWATIWQGDCLDVLATLPSASVDAVVTDPPYGLEFMGKEWDGANGFRRSLNPSDVGRDNAFGRTPHPSTTLDGARVRQERADEVTPKGQAHSTSAGPYLASGVDSVRVAGRPFQVWCQAWATECLRILKPGGHLLAFGGTRTWHRLVCAIEDAGFQIRDSIAWLYGSGFPKSLDVSKAIDKAAGHWRGRAGELESDNHSMGGGNYERTEKGDPVTAAAAAAGWGTALKPAFEPVCVARKPVIGTVAANFRVHGTGALNIDAGRIGTEVRVNPPMGSPQNSYGGYTATATATATAGRWPANVALDQGMADELDEQSGERPGMGRGRVLRRGATTGAGMGYGSSSPQDSDYEGYGASRFFYTAKADSGERITHNGVAHPTVKPLELMRWLVRLVTPPGGLILDPFAGSGTTVEAALLEGFRCVAIEREPDYLPLITQRIKRRFDPIAYLTTAGDDLGLFGEDT